MPKQDADLVVDILNLYQIIEHVKTTTRDERLIKDYYGLFRGFDGDHEIDCMSLARFLIEKQKKFQEQATYLTKNDNLNSHSPMMGKYSKMLAEAKKYPSIASLTPDEILLILNV
jgi:uncharacterized protein YfbU (UPF0304 family)